MEAADAQDDASPRRGLLLMLAATTAFVVMTAFVKDLREDGLSTPLVMLFRVGLGLPWVVAELRLRGHGLGLRSHRDVWLRSLFGLLAMAGYFWALERLSMLQNTILHLLQPIFVAILSPLLVGERIRGYALGALGLALVGAVAALEPLRMLRLEQAEVALLPATVGAAAALCSGLAHIMVRRSIRTEPPERVVLYFSLVITVASAAWAASIGGFALPQGLSWQSVAWRVAAMAGFGLAGQLLMTRAYGRARAPLVAMVAYTSVPLSIFFDIVAFDAHLGPGAIVGSVVMIGAGMLLMRNRETTRTPSVVSPATEL